MASSSGLPKMATYPLTKRTLHIYTEKGLDKDKPRVPGTEGLFITDSNKYSLLYTVNAVPSRKHIPDREVRRSSYPVDTSASTFNSDVAPVFRVGTIISHTHCGPIIRGMTMDLAPRAQGYMGCSLRKMTATNKELTSWEFESSGIGYLTWERPKSGETDLELTSEWSWVARLFYSKAYNPEKQGRIEIFNQDLPPYLLDEVVLSALGVLEKDRETSITLPNLRRRLGMPALD